MNKALKKSMLVILDGWGHGQSSNADALAQADTPFIDYLHKDFPNAELVTYGKKVGLPEGQMGNSEVGHLNIGAGRIVYQDLEKINQSIETNSLGKNPVLLEAIDTAKKGSKNFHLFGLVSDGGVHSHINHVKALCDILADHELDNVFIHCFLDGRDTDPTSGKGYIAELEEHIKASNVRIASVIGRYYAMDRDHRWERIQLAYNLIVHGKGEKTTDFKKGIQGKYDDGITDEFMNALVGVTASGEPVARIQQDDVVLSFNFRTDRPRQITTALTQKDFPDHNMSKIPLHFISMTRYDKAYQGIPVLFDKETLTKTIGEVISSLGFKQLRAAETEKYPHVTFFFSGGREENFINEERILVNSPKVATYDLQPEMSAFELTEKVSNYILKESPEFICINYANADMVGHTGIFEAGMKAAEAVDTCAKKLVSTALSKNYELIIIADHGNADYMFNEDGSPNTAHSMNPVPVIYVSNNPVSHQINDGILADVAPTLLHLMGIEQPEEMTGKSLIL